MSRFEAVTPDEKEERSAYSSSASGDDDDDDDGDSTGRQHDDDDEDNLKSSRSTSSSSSSDDSNEEVSSHAHGSASCRAHECTDAQSTCERCFARNLHVRNRAVQRASYAQCLSQGVVKLTHVVSNNSSRRWKVRLSRAARPKSRKSKKTPVSQLGRAISESRRFASQRTLEDIQWYTPTRTRA
jgi:hypothetical protein